ncbi:MAG: SDR family oxidoreductase [Candidatus Nanopelagicales bacterium]
MRIAVFGATGKTGLHLVDQALGRGWEVVAAVRHPGPLGAHGDLTLVEGDVLDPVVAARAIDGADAVLTALGFRRHLRGPSATTVYSDSARTLVDVMGRTGCRRLVYVTSAGVEHDDPAELWPYRHIVKPLWLDGGYDDMRAAEAIVRTSDLDWVLVRPGRLTDGPPTGTYDVSPRFRPEHANAISRADLAAFMLDQVTGDEWVHGTPTLGTRYHMAATS